MHEFSLRFYPLGSVESKSMYARDDRKRIEYQIRELERHRHCSPRQEDTKTSQVKPSGSIQASLAVHTVPNRELPESSRSPLSCQRIKILLCPWLYLPRL